MIKYGLLLFVVLNSFVTNAQELDKKYYETVSKFVAAVKSNDKEKVAKNVSYPFKRQYPLPDIKNASEFVKRYNEVFDQQLKKKIIQSSVATDWSDVGWRGIMLLQGSLWLDYNGKLIAVNDQSKFETDKRDQLIKAEKVQLYPSLRNYQTPICVFETSTYVIRIDELENANYRYVSWKRNKKMGSKPDLVITKGEFIPEGSGGNHSYKFKNGAYSFECSIILIGERNSPPAFLTVYKNDKPILKQKAVKFKP